MSLISKSIDDIKSFFDKKVKWLQKKLDNEVNEIHELESNLEKINIDKLNTNWWSDRKMIKFWIFGLLIALVWYFVFDLLNIIFLIIWAYIMSMIVESLIWWLEKRKIQRWLAVIVAYTIFVIFVLWLLVFVVPFLFSQTAELVSIWLKYISSFQDNLINNGLSKVIMDMSFIPNYIKEYILNYFWDSELLIQVQSTLQQNLNEIISIGKQYVQLFGMFIVNFISWFANFTIDFTLFMTLAILFSIEKDSVMKFLANIGGKTHYDLTYLKLEKMYKKLAIWLKARLILSLFVAVAMWLALLVMSRFWLDIPNKLWLAILTWLLDIIPYIWPFLSWALFFVIWLIYNTFLVAVLAVWILFWINLVQNNILTPIFMNKALGVNSVLILISMIIWWIIMWFLWVLLSVPIAVIITLLFQNREKLERENNDWGHNVLMDMVNKTKDKFKHKDNEKEKEKE